MRRNRICGSDCLLRVVCVLNVGLLGLCAAYCQDIASVNGRIQGGNQKEVRIYTINNYLEFRPIVLVKVTTDTAGKFATVIPMGTAMPLRIVCGSDFPMLVWIEKGDSVFVDIKKPYNLTHQESGSTLDKGIVHFSGRGADINNYLFDADLMIYEPKTHQTARTRSIKAYWIFLDSLQRTRQHLRQIAFPQKFSPRAEEFLQGEVVASTFYHKAMAEVYKTNKTKEDSADLANPAMRKYWSNWSFQSDLALPSDSYRQSLLTYFNQAAQEKLGRRPFINGEREVLFASTYREANTQLQDLPGTREYFSAFVLYHMASFVEGSDSLQVLTRHFHHNFPESDYDPILAKRLQSKMDVTKTAPEIIGLDMTNHLFSLKALKGKPIYIDIWASWCGPCLQELPNSKMLAAKFKDKLHVVYLNISDTEQAWRRIIKKQQLESSGFHLHADEETTNKIRKAYNIGPIPRYILIDKEGKVFQSNAARPADVEEDIIRLVD